jgi:hypothetical protein
LNKRRVQNSIGIDRNRRFRYYVDLLEKELIAATISSSA